MNSPGTGEGRLFLETQVIVVNSHEVLHRSREQLKGRCSAILHVLQVRLQVQPCAANLRVIDQDAVGGGTQISVLGILQYRNDVPLLVFVMGRGSDPEVPKDISGGLTCLSIDATAGNVPLHARQHRQ